MFPVCSLHVWHKKQLTHALAMLHMHTKYRSHNLFTLTSESRNGKHCINENRADPPGAAIFNAKIMWSSIKAVPKKPEETTDCLLFLHLPQPFFKPNGGKSIMYDAGSRSHNDHVL